ncbi:hypothetical protein CRE_22921 [Caenorhabditis remanei]|uniref:F-box domain-containing protein n=1 Tax=Caenorhabditis remanei TaxID=31234 RepID=E3MW50_CAERE|nr:hypothetical protein CRE_22921 [Caenorhabditis remanei]
MPPTSSCLNEDYLEGYLYCLHSQGVVVTDAHAQLLAFTRTEIFDLLKVLTLFRSVQRGRYKMRHVEKLVLAEGSQVSENALMEMIALQTVDDFTSYEKIYEDVATCYNWQHIFDRQDVDGHLSRAENREYQLEEVERDYNPQALRGFLICLKSQDVSAKEAFDQLNKAAPEQQIFELKDVKKLFERVDRGEFFERKWPRETWLDKLPDVVNSRIVQKLDLMSRQALKQTCKRFNEFVDREKCVIDSLVITQTQDSVEISTYPRDIFYKKFVQTEKGYAYEDTERMVYNDGRIVLKEKVKGNLKCIFGIPNLRINNLYILDPRYCNFDVYRNLAVENLYLRKVNLVRIHSILEALTPGVLKKVVYLPADYLLTETVYDMDQWRLADSFVTYRTRKEGVVERLGHFCFGKIEITNAIDLHTVLQLRQRFLQNPHFREFKITIPPLGGQKFAVFNMNLGVYDTRRSDPWAHFHYPAPNQHKRVSIRIFDELIWFKGPEYIEGESDRVEKVPKVQRVYSMNGLEYRDRAQYLANKLCHYTAHVEYEGYIGFRDVHRLVEILLENPKFKEMRINCRLTQYNLDRIYKLGIAMPFTVGCEIMPFKQYLYPPPIEKKSLLLFVKKDFIWFVGPTGCLEAVGGAHDMGGYVLAKVRNFKQIENRDLFV